MRNLFLALVLVNLLFWAWHSWFAADALPTLTIDDQVPTIELASESDSGAGSSMVERLPAPSGEAPPQAAEPRPQSAPPQELDSGAEESGNELAAAGEELTLPDEPDPEPVAAAEPERCISVGPFRELAQAVGAGANLRAAGYEPVQHAGEGDIWVGYWVFIEGIANRDEAESMLDTLHNNGMDDAYLIPGSVDGDVISLGVYSEVQRAGVKREEARALGFDPTIVDRTRRGTVYWVDIMLASRETLDFDLLQTPGRILRLEQKPCEEADD